MFFDTERSIHPALETSPKTSLRWYT